MASRNIGSIYASLTLSDINFRRGLANASKQLNAFAAKSLKWGAAGALGGLTAEIYSAVSAASEMQDINIQFEVLTGSAEKAKDMLAKLRQEAAASPLSFTDFAKAAQTLIGFGADQSKVIEYTKELSEVSAGNAERFKSLALAFAQSGAAGRLMGQDVLQFVNAGFNPLLQISKKTGESMVALKKRMEDGLIPFSEVEQAFKDATSAGGMFYGMNEKASKTFSGKIAKMKDQFQQLQIQIGTPVIDGISPVLDKVSSYDFSSLGDSIAAAISAGFTGLQDGLVFEAIGLKFISAMTLATGRFIDIFREGIIANFENLPPLMLARAIAGGDAYISPLDAVHRSMKNENPLAGMAADLSKDADTLWESLEKRSANRALLQPPAVSSPPARALAPAPPPLPPAAVAAIKYEYQGIPQVRPDVNDYQRRGLSLDGNPQVKTESILEKQTKVLVEMRDALKRMANMNPTAVW